jgi:hypothetical protein
MAVPILDLNLAPRPSLWRQHHLVLGWTALGLGLMMLLGGLGLTWRAYHQASRAGREAVSLTEEARRAATKEQQIQASLLEMDATREQSRWKLAERILMERALPWSRLTAELEQCMVPDMRLKALQRTRSSGQQVVMKLKGEARTRQAEAAFIEALHDAPIFTQVVLEREAERVGGGWEFELSLPTASVPAPFQTRVLKAIHVAPARPSAAPAPKPAQTMLPAPRPQAAKTPMAPPPSQPAPPLQAGAPESFGTRPAPDNPRPGARSGPAQRRVHAVRSSGSDGGETP